MTAHRIENNNFHFFVDNKCLLMNFQTKFEFNTGLQLWTLFFGLSGNWFFKGTDFQNKFDYNTGLQQLQSQKSFRDLFKEKKAFGRAEKPQNTTAGQHLLVLPQILSPGQKIARGPATAVKIKTCGLNIFARLQELRLVVLRCLPPIPPPSSGARGLP